MENVIILVGIALVPRLAALLAAVGVWLKAWDMIIIVVLFAAVVITGATLFMEVSP